MNEYNSKDAIHCPECGWIFPRELLENLVKGRTVYCERCGSESKRTDFNEADLARNLKQLVNTVKEKSGKAVSKIRDRLRKAFKKTRDT